MAPNTQHYTQRRYLDDGNPDGTKFSQSPRSNPDQSPVLCVPTGQVVTYQETLTPASIAAITTAEQALTVGTTAGNGPATTDFVAAINKPTAQAGIGVHSARISAANTIQLVLSNTTGGFLTPTATQVYNVTLLRGVRTITQSLTPGVISANSTNESIFNIAPTTPATFLLSVDGVGKIINFSLVQGGANYWQVPKIVVTDTQGGTGAVLKVNLDGAGALTNPIIEDPGLGYVAPTATAIGGNDIDIGSVLMVTKPTTTAGAAISNVRVSGRNQIAIQMVNPTAAAITPTAENYVMCALNDAPAVSNIVSYGVVATGLASIAANTSAEQALTVTGLLATDIAIGVSKPTLNAGIALANWRVSGANALSISLGNFTGAAITPSATEIYGVTIYRQNSTTPFRKFAPVLSPASIAANTTAEQTFTVTGVPLGSTITVNKQSHQPGLAIAGYRVTAANTIGITFENVTAVAITPTAAEVYLVGCFMAVAPGGGTPGSWVALPFAQSLQDAVQGSNEIKDTLVEEGIMKGA